MLLWVLQRELLNAIPRMQKRKYSEGFRVIGRWNVGGGPTGFQLWLCLGRRSTIALSSGGRGGVSSPLTTAPTRWRRSCFSGSRNRLVAPAGTEHAGAQTQMRRRSRSCCSLPGFAHFTNLLGQRGERGGGRMLAGPRARRRGYGGKKSHVADVKTMALL